MMEHVYGCTGHALKIPDIVDSRGAYLVDAQGRRYMDLESGVWCISVGHGNERITEAMTRQMQSLMHAGFCYSHRVLEQAAEAVLDITNLPEGKCVFLCSGSEAIEVSRQMARHLTGKSLSMALHDSYLGAYTSVSDRSKGWYIFDWEQCKSCGKNDTCDLSCSLLQDIPQVTGNGYAAV